MRKGFVKSIGAKRVAMNGGWYVQERWFLAKKERQGKDQQVGRAMSVEYEGPQMGQCFVKLRSEGKYRYSVEQRTAIKPATAWKIVLEPAD